MDYGFTNILTLLGSLGLFLYGMTVMSDALLHLAGNRMRSILATTTSNRIFAVLTGFFITAVIQSSSATTLMVVSFVNASLLTLTEAVGVIMGANIGTTVTAWLISILGFKVKISAIAIPLIGAGFLLSLSQHKTNKNWGRFIIGFALLFIGLQFLKDSVPDIRNHPEVLAFLVEYTTLGYFSVLFFMVAGTLLTLIVQSSSAAMALTLVMCHEGWLPFDSAAAMVLGQNLGTTITANLAALVANYHAKRAARAHLLFNLIGVIGILLLFYPFINWVGGIAEELAGESPFLNATAIPVALSLFHTSFNILNTLFLLGFVPSIVKIAEAWVPPVIEKEREIDEPKFLTEASLRFPQTGIKALKDESLRLLENSAYKILAHGLSVHRGDIESEQKLRQILEKSNQAIPIDIDQVYATRIKTIYGRILEYATQLQSKFPLQQPEIESIRNILIANRMLVQVVKQMKPLNRNIERFIGSDNQEIRREYNVLRRRILKVVREIHRIGSSEHLEEHLQKIKLQRAKAEELDVLESGRIQKLIMKGEISDRMASSLINDSANARRITQMLVDISTVLYSPTDTQIAEIDAQQTPEEKTLEEASTKS
ncbi:Na/Pi cotransporter family protein [Candidatus Endoriftia persephone]|jgi:phosphate:Na+ symporter|uniref:Na/Pi symporter n=3 Tax=Gammaproteobacteria TaxID=1236 RepID=A0A9J6ZWD9_9GAMM|nr:Na/Pi symporter [Candidatus Endoriftia persephone]EGV50483.1 putative transmembrane Na+/Pi-cotransporter [endosymbiont of Riftia pachyptila (vent Ph05)]EGW53039.1 putative transmembrane Na+/Pi-cotransporter [endosymbiont of Tevnia jerichonana (vent Tica)]USF87082.1 Na/Pi symporter [Candidatus Endoriftia persephone]